MTLLETARRIADDVLFPAAAAVDRAPSVPVLQLELLASSGLYGAAAPVSAGGADLALPAFGEVVEALAGGSLATAFVWTQHHGLVRALAADAPAELCAQWLPALAAGTVKAGAAYGGLLPGAPLLRATPNRAGGWLLTGHSPWVTGWGLVDVLHVAARTPDGAVVWLIVDAVERPGLSAERQRTVAADAARTVRLTFAGLPVPAGRERAVVPYRGPEVGGPPLRTNGSLALGVAGRCVALLDGGPAEELGAELAACRAALDEAVSSTVPGAMATARAAASELAVRAAAALAVATGSAAALSGSHAERLTREALFLLVFGSRPPIRAALLDRLSGLG